MGSSPSEKLGKKKTKKLTAHQLTGGQVPETDAVRRRRHQHLADEMEGVQRALDLLDVRCDHFSVANFDRTNRLSFVCVCVCVCVCADLDDLHGGTADDGQPFAVDHARPAEVHHVSLVDLVEAGVDVERALVQRRPAAARPPVLPQPLMDPETKNKQLILPSFTGFHLSSSGSNPLKSVIFWAQLEFCGFYLVLLSFLRVDQGSIMLHCVLEGSSPYYLVLLGFL